MGKNWGSGGGASLASASRLRAQKGFKIEGTAPVR